jgi:3-phenylpropionate/cinnamic acid dioxygenase small subunit
VNAGSVASSAIALGEAEQFIYREARHQDEHDYEAWEALWTDDATYWVPAGDDDSDPTRQMSIIYDNRSRIATRVRQLLSGTRHAQRPPSRLRRLIANVELLGDRDGDVLVGANFVIVESRARGRQLWAGRSEYRLRRTADGVRMAGKKVMLVDNDQPLYTLAFLV